jgi:hypothetical protein
LNFLEKMEMGIAEISGLGTSELYILFVGAVAGIAAIVIGISIAYFFMVILAKKRAEKEYRAAISIVYQEIKDNIYSLNAGSNIGMMKVSTSGLELLRARNIYLDLPSDVLRDLLSVYWYFNFINDVVNWELSLFMVSVMTNGDTGRICEINDRHTKDFHRRCLKEIQNTKILPRLEVILNEQ